jgi:hypothetical protein
MGISGWSCKRSWAKRSAGLERLWRGYEVLQMSWVWDLPFTQSRQSYQTTIWSWKLLIPGCSIWFWRFWEMIISVE